VLPVSSSAALAALPAADVDGWRQAPGEETLPGGDEDAPPAEVAALSPSIVDEDAPLTAGSTIVTPTLPLDETLLPPVTPNSPVEGDDAPPAEDAALPPITVDENAPLAGGPTVITPTLPLYLDLRVDRFVMAPGETALLTVMVYSQVESDVPGLTLALELPAGLATAGGESGELRWPLLSLAPGPENTPSWQQTLILQADLADVGVEQAALTLVATLTAPGYETVAATTLLGVAPPATVMTNIQSAAGTVLRDVERGVTLLVPAGAAPPGALFQYEPVYRADEATPTATPTPTVTPTVTPSVTPSPGVTSSATPPATETVETVTPTVTPEPPQTPIVTTAPPMTEQATNELSDPATAEGGEEPSLLPTDEPDTAGEDLDGTTPVAGAAITLTLTVTAPTVPAEGESPTATLTVTTPITLEAAGDTTLYLPAVSSGGEPGQAAAVEAEATITTTVTATLPDGELVPRWVDGVQVYQQWEFNAIHAGQPITRFAEAMLLLIDARWLVEAGLDPAELDLWTRETSDDEWLLEEATYDAEQQHYVARLTHFSGAAIGDGLSARGEILPTLTLFATDHGTGAATVRYPIEAPTGLGGQSPGLALTYSSSAVDDYLLLGGDDDYVNQAHWVGYGWNLAGISYIHRSEIGSASSMGYYSIVLNGLRSHINGGRDPNAFIDHDYFTKIQPVEPNAGNGNFHGWTVTGADGTVYTFGGAVLNGNWPTTEASRDTPLSLHLRASKARVYDHWYLSEVRDRLGNRMTYHYDAYRGSIINWSMCGTGFGNENEVWYTRTVLPREIRWSYTDSTASSYKMRVRFIYSGETRADYKVSGYDDSCKQPVYTRKRLTDLYVEVKENGTSNWLVLRRYGLSALEEGSPLGYPCANQCAPSGELHLLLDKISHYGKGGGGTPLHEFKFTYYAETAIAGANAAMTTNNVRLQKADNGWKGVVEYRYVARLLSNSECNYNLVCQASNQGNERRYRFAVDRVTTFDGRGYKRVTDYSYANPKMRGELHDGNIHSREFLGFETVLATRYATVAEAQTPSTELRYEELRFHQALVSPDPNNNNQPTPRDPRAGKQQFRKVWSEPTSACPGLPRCLLVQEYNNWNAQRRTGATWNTWNNEQTGPYWVRLDHTNHWAGSVGKWTRYFYNPVQQNNNQYGNVTEVHELTHFETALDFNSWQNRVGTNTQLTLLRKTVTEYYPNTTGHIVNRPARVRILKADDTCVAEVRSVYDNVDGHYQTAPSNGVLKKNEQALSACSSAQSIGQYDGAWAITRYAHDSYGNVLTVNRVGAASNGSQNDITMTTYDPFYKLFPIEQYKTNLPIHLINAGLAYKETGAYYGVNVSLGAGDTKYFWGGMAEHCAVNGVCTRQSYDAFGRPHHRWERVAVGAAWWADNSQNASANVRWGYSAPSGSQTAFIVTEWRSPRCYGNFVRRHYNGLGQLIIEQRPDQSWQTSVDGCGGADQGQEIDTYYAYDALGRPTWTSAPKLVSRSGYATRTGDWGVGYTATVYDRIDRPTQITTPSGENSYFSYAGRASHHYGRDRAKATNQSQAYKTLRWQELDEWGYLRYVRTYEYNGTSWGSAYAQVTLAHDVLGNLKTVTHPGSLGTTSMSYDLGGRKTSMSDPDLGTWTYTYDRQHKLTKQTDARSKTICLYYDTLQRLQGKHLPSTSTCPNPGGYPVTYGYDENHGTNNRSLGQLTSVWNSGVYPKRLYYDAKGRLKQETVTIPGNSTVFSTQYIYDDYNRLSVLQYPDNSYVKQTYNSMGLQNVLCEAILSGGVYSCTSNPQQVNNVRMVDGSITGGGIPNGVAYDHAGRVTQMRLPMGGNLWRTYTYAPFNQQDSQGGRLTTIQLGNSQTGIEQMWLRYLYDSFGNVKTWYENYDGGVNTSTWNFTYDAHHRLTNGFGQNYAYDTAGRLTGYEGASYGYLAAPAHAVNTVGGLDRYDYDANGNVSVRHKGLSTQQTLTWSHENRLASLTATGINESYLYDDTGIRVKKVSGGATTYYPFPHYEVSNGVVTKYYFFNGQRVAMRQNGVLFYLHPEHLGGNLFATDTSGAKSSWQGYYAYGKTRWGNLQTDHRFTGQKYDNTGLYYFNARYYDPVIGTFISPDTLVPDPTNVWDYNRFAYARLNPMKFTDPSGYYSNDEIMQHFGCTDWACVEAYFQEGGAYAGLWGWLYILQMAQNGDAVTAFGAGAGGRAIQATLGGVFQRSAAGQIEIVANYYESSATGLRRFNAVVPEGGFATLAKAYDYGHYTLSGSANVLAGRNDPKNYFHFDPSKIDKGGLALAGLKAGADFGPVIMEKAGSCADPACAGAVFTLGFSYTVVGYTTVLVADVIIPVSHAFTSGDTGPAWESIAVEFASRWAGKADRFVNPAYDVAKAVGPGFCYGTGCPR
jgi:RHS repeat-associated protein